MENKTEIGGTTGTPVEVNALVSLLPCPFCGNTNVNEVIRPHFDIGTIAVECSDCQTRGPEYRYNGKEKYNRLHVLWWNTRPESTKLAKLYKLYSDCQYENDTIMACEIRKVFEG